MHSRQGQEAELNEYPKTELWLGVTGHRPNKLKPATLPRIRAQCAAVLDALAGMPVRLGVVSALAEGADRMIADLALLRGLPLRCILPFASTEYERDFESAESVVEFRRLLAQARAVEELPGEPGARSTAYEAAGRAMLDASGVLIAIWDGNPAAGRGGSAQMIDEAVARAIPVIWINAAGDAEPLLRFHGDAPFTTAHNRLLTQLPAATARSQRSAPT